LADRPEHRPAAGVVNSRVPPPARADARAVAVAARQATACPPALTFGSPTDRDIDASTRGISHAYARRGSIASAATACTDLLAPKNHA